MKTYYSLYNTVALVVLAAAFSCIGTTTRRTVHGFQVRTVPVHGRTSESRISTTACTMSLSLEDSAEYAEVLPLSAHDLSRFTDLRKRHVTMPIMILDAMLPKQRLQFKSDDPKFRRLIEYCFNDEESDGRGFQLAMLGLNPYTGKPLCRGVTLSVSDETIHFDAVTRTIAMSAKGEQRIEVQGEPWLDETGSFYLADIEIIDQRYEPALTNEQDENVRILSKTLPSKIQEWSEWVLKTKATDRKGLELRMKDLGPMPSEDNPTDRALWTAALLNPLPALGVCLEIRPAMLSCSNDLERMVLACQAVQSSIDHMSGKHKLF